MSANATLTPDTDSTAEGSSIKQFQDVRSCTRCNGEQHCLKQGEGFALYRCDTCEMRVGIDMGAEDKPEFLAHRGSPSQYTKDQFGMRLTSDELRVNRVS